MKKKLVVSVLIFLMGGLFCTRGIQAGEQLQQDSLIVQSESFIITTGDSVTIAASEKYLKNGIHHFFFGKHYRELWALPVTVEVFNLEQSENISSDNKIFTPIKKGGNQQTVTVRLKANDGKTYVIRGLDKVQTNALPPNMRFFPLTFFMEDQTSALNPYAALAIPPLAHAAGLYHTNPKLIFIPDQNPNPLLNSLSGQMAILEEFPDKSWTETDEFGEAEKILSEDKFAGKRMNDPEMNIDTKMFVKARLFDILIGDWDRHSGQWKWGKQEKENEVIYQPIPRDRDMAFFKFRDGFLNRITLLFIPKFQTFDTRIYNLKGYLYNSRKQDQLLLPMVDESEWIHAAETLKTEITDSVINESINQWPAEVREKVGAFTAEALKARRDNLPDIARDFYKLINTHPKISGTDKPERFIITRVNNNTTRVEIYYKGKLISSRIFDHNITKQISLYGLGGDDEFEVRGDVQRAISLNLYGGEGKDKYIDNSIVKGWLKRVRIIDYKNENYFMPGGVEENVVTRE
ncbi:MAG: hypothetical protein ACK40G_00470 [Cytophagaceae bacterium]